MDELVQRHGRVLTHLSSLPSNSSKQQAPLISFLVSTQIPGSLTPTKDRDIHSIALTRSMPAKKRAKLNLASAASELHLGLS